MNDSSNTPEPARTHHRVFCSWPCGSFISLGDHPGCEDFQQLVNLLGPPTVVEFRATDEGWVDSDCQDIPSSVFDQTLLRLFQDAGLS